MIALVLAIAGTVAAAGLRPSGAPAQGHGPMGAQVTEVSIFEEEVEHHTITDKTTTTWTTTTVLDWPNSTKDWPSLFCWVVSQTVGGRLNRVQGWMEEQLIWEMYS